MQKRQERIVPPLAFCFFCDILSKVYRTFRCTSWANSQIDGACKGTPANKLNRDYKEVVF